MPERIPQSTAITVPLKAYLTDGTTDATGKTIAVQISKNGAAFGNPSAGATNATEIANGWYTVALSVTDTATVGPLIVRGTATGCDNSELVYNVTADAATWATALLDLAAGVETGLTVRQGLRLFAAALLGKVSGAAVNAPVFRDTGDTKNRISAVTDSNGNRSSVTLDGS
jgi:hypothetical protein